MVIRASESGDFSPKLHALFSRFFIISFISFALAIPLAASAADSGQLEEVVVTAQRTSENIQDVPIAITALTGEMLELKQVITVSDLQMNAPNVSFTNTNFGSNSLSIRGIGRLLTAATGDAGVSVHTNGIAIAPNMNASEFYDMERVEILRGPQGTLYGKNATGGVVNLVTKMPDFDSVNGFVEVEAGDYENLKVKAAINIPMGDNFAVRIAGFSLERDGYTDNLAAGQVGVDGRVLTGLSKEVDGRDHTDFRITGRWQITENANLWVTYNKYDEDSNRARVTNQVCVTGDLPVYGCKPNEVGFEQPHNTAQFSNLVAGLYSLHPLGNPKGTGVFNWPRPALGLRSMHTDFEPVYINEIEQTLFGFTYDFDQYTLGISGGYSESYYLTRQDYNMNVGNELGPNFYRSDGLWPISLPAGGPGDESRPGPCNIFDGNSGVIGGVCQEFGYTQSYTFDQSDSEGEYWTVEIKFQSNFDGPFNFLVGYTEFDGHSSGNYYVNANTLDGRPDMYPGFFNNFGHHDGGGFGEGSAVFGEIYYRINDDVKLTFGLRRNDDDKRVRGNSVLWNATDANFPLSTAVAGNMLPKLWTRAPDFVNGGAATGAELGLINLYAPTADLTAAEATGAQSPERMAIAGTIPVVPDFLETRVLTGSPTEFNWQETTGRVGIDWQMNDNLMLYAFLSRGYKPGGANPAIPPQFQSESKFDFDQEDIDAIEFGAKSTLLDGSMILNANLFIYDYEGLQVARIKNNTSLNENIDAEMIGAEVEVIWQPQAVENLQIDFAYSWLDSEVDAMSVDPSNRTGGDPDYVAMNNIAFMYAAPRDALIAALPIIMTAGVGAGAVVPVPGTITEDGIPVIIARPFLDAIGIENVEGIPVDLYGNQLPNAPEHSIHLGASYTWNIAALAGDITVRWDYYWQDDSYAREFNTVGDQIDSWDQHNLSLLYSSTDSKWQAKAFVRNVQDEDNVTGHYLTSDTSGYYRNYFLTEPRIFGFSVKYNFGGN